MCVDNSWDDEERGRKLHQTVCLFMDRSRNRPLNIILFFFRLPQSSGLQNVIETLIHNSRRWETFTISPWSAITPHPAFQSVKNTLTSLRGLYVLDGVDGSTVIQDLGHTPALQTLHVDFTRFPTAEVQALFATQLKRVHIHLSAGDTPVSARQLASLCTSIQRLDLKIWEGQLADEAPYHGSSIAGELEHLQLDLDSYPSSLFLDAITAPRLSSVDLNSFGLIQNSLGPVLHLPWDPHLFLSFIRRSSCSITSLSLLNFTLGSDQQAAQFFSCMPAVRSLTIIEREIPRRMLPTEGLADARWSNITQTTSLLLQKLCVRGHGELVEEVVGDIAQGGELSSSSASTQGPLLPSLVDFRLEISGKNLNRTNTDTLMKIVASRWITDADDRARAGLAKSLLSVDIKSSDGRGSIPESLTSQLKNLSDVGLEVFIRYVEDN
ncbi:hypothetical protein AAF712_013460 [Marasmius tenuissimus]|uniref:F-box domain-containing protein n=1 Tax=Marasmius tenuissimus TaxID=585030 RepID=A0ABR2ZEM6_9AGAR